MAIFLQQILLFRVLPALCFSPPLDQVVLRTDGSSYTQASAYVDGGLWANNPALVAILEAHRRLGIPLGEISVTSVGNGEAPQGDVGTDFNLMRRAFMIQPVLDLLFSTQSELADRASAHLLKDEGMRGDRRRMLRVNADLKKLIDLDDSDNAAKILLPRADEKVEETFTAFSRMIA